MPHDLHDGEGIGGWPTHFGDCSAPAASRQVLQGPNWASVPRAMDSKNWEKPSGKTSSRAQMGIIVPGPDFPQRLLGKLKSPGDW